MKRRIIVEIRDDIPDDVALRIVTRVVELGRISKGVRDQDHYCWATTFAVGDDEIVVYTREKYKTQADSFIVAKNKAYKRRKQ
jgi:hypothetical protein